ncbi:hypothetical protein Tco_1334999 [Tanacetum coccineum]
MRALWSLNEDILKIIDLKNNTPYPSRRYEVSVPAFTKRPLRIEDQYAVSRRPLYASIEEVMADKGKKSSMETFVLNDKADYYSGIKSITVNGKNAYVLKGKFLDDLHNKAFSGTNGKDAVELIEYYLKIIDPIRLPNKLGGDEIDVSDDENSDHEEYWSNKEETAKIFKIETDVFDYETPICSAFKEFNYLFSVDLDLFTKDIEGFKTYKDFKNDWIYKWNKDVPWVDEKPWTEYGVWTKPTPVIHTCKPFNYKTGCSEWPTCSWKDDGYCNGGNLPGTYIIGNQLHNQDYDWFEALEDSELKDLALRNKASKKGLINDDDDESRHEQRKQ